MHTHARHKRQDPENSFLQKAKPEALIKYMMDTINELSELYKAESEVLRNSDTKGFTAMQDKKFRLAQKYQEGVKHILARQTEMKALPEETKQKLKDMQKNFSALADENMTALSRMQKCIDKFHVIMRRAITDKVKKENTYYYTASGKTSSDNKRSLQGALSETA